MRKSFFAVALAALMGVAQPAAAQHVTVSLRLGDGPVAIRGYYASRPQYVIPRRFVCEPDGSFLYCWDREAYRVEQPVIYVYPADRRCVPVRRHERRAEDGKDWRPVPHGAVPRQGRARVAAAMLRKIGTGRGPATAVAPRPHLAREVIPDL